MSEARIYPPVEEMLTALTDHGIDTELICNNNLTLIYSLLGSRHISVEDIARMRENDRRSHEDSPESFGFLSALQDYQPA